MTDLARTLEVVRMIQEDCNTDAAQLDGAPFTARGMGETFGTQLAMIAAVAKATEKVALEVESLERILQSRTEHLA